MVELQKASFKLFLAPQARQADDVCAGVHARMHAHALFKRAWCCMRRLDQLVPSWDYTDSNCVPCCHSCNGRKQTKTVSEFLEEQPDGWTPYSDDRCRRAAAPHHTLISGMCLHASCMQLPACMLHMNDICLLDDKRRAGRSERIELFWAVVAMEKLVPAVSSSAHLEVSTAFQAAAHALHSSLAAAHASCCDMSARGCTADGLRSCSTWCTSTTR